jgi:hypothetical protein
MFCGAGMGCRPYFPDPGSPYERRLFLSQNCRNSLQPGPLLRKNNFVYSIQTSLENKNAGNGFPGVCGRSIGLEKESQSRAE